MVVLVNDSVVCPTNKCCGGVIWEEKVLVSSAWSTFAATVQPNIVEHTTANVIGGNNRGLVPLRPEVSLAALLHHCSAAA